jgi:adenylate cyclase
LGDADAGEKNKIAVPVCIIRKDRSLGHEQPLVSQVVDMGEAMTSTPITRRLGAIVIADVVGYSRLMEQDEGGTHARLREIRDEVVDPQITAFGGRIVRTTGDGMLLEFGSAAAALRFAIEVQRTMGVRNQALASDTQIHFRIGINLGDIIVDGVDIAGDGVNIAARLETLSEPGGICISSAVQDQIHEDLGVEFFDIGDQYVKNITRPIRVYRVVPRIGDAQRQFRRRWQRLRRAIASRRLAGGALALGIVGITFWTFQQFWKSDVAPPLPLSVAILPLSVTGGSAADGQLADTFTQDITSALETSAHWVRVTSHSLAATYKSNPIDARRVGRDLNARYLVEGLVRRSGELVTVNLQLIDAGTATQLWSGRLDIEQSQIVQNREDIVARLTRRLYVALYDAEMHRTAGTPAPGASAMDLTMHAWGVLSRDYTVKGTLEARKWFDRALDLDPNLVLALRGRWRTLQYEYDLDSHADRNRLVQEMDDLSFRAVSVDETDSHAWWDRAETLSRQRRWDAALEANTKAHRLDPSFGGPRNQRAAIMFYMGRPAEALMLIDQELALDPREPSEVGAAMQVRCAASLALGRYDDAISACAKCVALDNWWLPHLYLVASYAQKGDSANTDVEKATLLRLRPAISISDFKGLWYSDNPDFMQQSEAHLLAGLRKAGIPEQ